MGSRLSTGTGSQYWEKITVPWYRNWPDLCPCSALEFANYFGVFYTLGSIFCVLTANALFTCPALYGHDQCQTPIAFALVVTANVLANLFCFHYFKRHNRISYLFPGRLRDDGIESEHTKYCYTCKETVPKRSHHCPLCNYCVLRKDHHCFLVGGCVGFGNHRYFITFLFWCAVGAAYGTSYTWTYLNRFYKPFFPLGWIDWIGPIAFKKWIFFQHCSLWHLCLCMLFTISFSSVWGALGFFVSQWYFLFLGRTMQEFVKKKDRREAGTFAERIRMIFGPYWFANFLFPMPFLRNRLDPNYGRILYSCYLKDL